MIRQEAIEAIKEFVAYGEHVNAFVNKWSNAIPIDALNIAIKALEQKSCEDAVSRQAVLDKAYAYGNGLEPEGYCVNVEDVQALPSVVPTRKTGKWIVYPLMDEGRVELECPICGDTSIRAVNYKPHFCENCGAKMKG